MQNDYFYSKLISNTAILIPIPFITTLQIAILRQSYKLETINNLSAEIILGLLPPEYVKMQ